MLLADSAVTIVVKYFQAENTKAKPMTLSSTADGSLLISLTQPVDYYGQPGQQRFELVLTAEQEADLLAELLVRRQGRECRVAGRILPR